MVSSAQTGRGDVGGNEDEAGEPRRPGRPRNRSYDRVILDATLEILNAQGYAGLTIDSVAARTGVGRPTIYRRWSSKAALVIAALTQSPGLSPLPDTGRVRDDLLAFQAEQVRMMDEPASRRITAGLVADPELAETYVRDYIGRRRTVVWQALQRGIDLLEPSRAHPVIEDAREAGHHGRQDERVPQLETPADRPTHRSSTPARGA